MKLSSDFIFTVCQVGAEGALKKEMLRDYPDFRFAFSRPGYLTFKRTQGPFEPDFSLESVFTRAYGASRGSIQSDEWARVVDLGRAFKAEFPRKNLFLHVWDRDQYAPGEEPLGFVPGSWTQGVDQKVRALAPGLFQDSKSGQPQFPQLGDGVVHIIGTDADRFGLGFSIHSHSHSVWPGGRAEVALPEESPSRAYLKLEETLLWSKAPLQKGDMAVEIGSAPGGASFALLQRGVRVVGIDPGVMDSKILKNPDFKHLHRTVAQVMREDLPESIQWLLLDMNVDPRVSLFAVDRLGTRMKSSLLGVILTIKLNQWAFADEIPYFLDHVRAMGMVKVKAAQLSTHRQEFVIFGLTRLGQMRKTAT